jgi:hypothetical protein
MKRAVFGACCAVALTAVVSAQGKNMATNKMDPMSMEKAYSGCLERSEAGAYSLTHVMTAGTNKSLKKDDAMAKDAMAKNTMAPASLSLSAAGKDLSTYVGHKVTVTGHDGDSMNGMATFEVKSLKTSGVSCS